jgi:flagellar motility protein MotE (MotC chaperone)
MTWHENATPRTGLVSRETKHEQKTSRIGFHFKELSLFPPFSWRLESWPPTRYGVAAGSSPRQRRASLPGQNAGKGMAPMTRRLPALLLLLLCAGAPALGAEEHGEKKPEPAPAGPDLPGLKKVPLKKPVVAAPKPLAVEGVRGAENFCASLAAAAASTRLAWQESRVKALQAEIIVKIAELDAKEAEVRDWVARREQLLAKASDSLIAIYAKMKPEAASAHLQAMDDDTAAALLLKLKPSVASAVLGEMEAARAARLSDLLTGAAPQTPPPPPPPAPTEGKS